MAFGLSAGTIATLATGALSAGGAIAGAVGAGNASSNAAKQAAWTPVDIAGNAGNVGVITDKNGVTNYVNNGSNLSQATNGQLTSGANANLGLFNKLSTSLDPTQALNPGVSNALTSANNAFSDVNNPGAFFDPNGNFQFQQLGNQTLGSASAANGNAQTALAGGGAVGTANGLGSSLSGASQAALTALGNFDPQAYAAQAKSQLDALAAPGETSATQSLFNSLQSSGRLGLTQNGELGDIGGLALAQSTANNQRSLQAAQLGLQQQQQLSSNASNFASGANTSLATGSNLQTGAVNNAGAANSQAQGADAFGLSQLLNSNNLSQQNALQRFSLASTALGLGNNQISQQQQYGLNSINAGLQENSGDLNSLNSSVNASAVRSGAQSNAGALAVAGANNTANNLGSLFSGLAPTIGKTLAGLSPNPGTTQSTVQPFISTPQNSAPAAALPGDALNNSNFFSVGP